MSIFSRTVPTKTLAVNLAANATGAVLYLNNQRDWDGSDLVAGDFGTQLFASLRNSANTQLELIELDSSTIGSAAITILKRGLSYDGGQIDSAVTSYAWTANDTFVELGSHTPQLLALAVEQVGDETIDGIKTFTSSPIAPTPTTATQVAIKSYVDGVAIAGAPDASTTVKGIVKMSTAPASATSPIAVGDNDVRVPTADENNALVGNNTDIAVGSGNKMVTQTGLQHNAEKYAADAGANDTYVITLSPVPTSYTNGMVVHFKANTVNTGAATLNVNSLGAKTIVKFVNTTLGDGDIAAGMFCTVIYDGTNFVLQNPTSGVIANDLFALTTANSISVAAVDNSFTLRGLPKFITIKYLLTGKNATGQTTYSKGIATYNGSGTLVSAFSDYTSGQVSTNILYGAAVHDTTAPTVGTASGSGAVGTMTISAISATSFTVRWDVTFNGGATCSNIFLPTASY